MPEEQVPPVNAQDELLEDGAASGGSPLMAKLKLVGLVLAVVLVECVFASFWLPDVSDLQAKAAAGIDESQDAMASEIMQDKGFPQVEIDLGEYSVNAYQPISSTTIRIDCHLYAMINEENSEEFITLKNENDARFREQINTILRAANISELTDPGLGLIKRRILEKTNRTLGKPLVRGVIFSDFSFMEQ
ncbi:MAG: flagellar basal body-associated FliL family protein [Pirellulales bacterium]|nr:flagellar basal body-associated FliL family protein [Pirellulales bacterium]